LPVTASGLSGATLQAFLDENCFPQNPNLNCSEYDGSFTPDHPCRADLPKKQWGGKFVWPVTVNASVCSKLETVTRYTWSPDTCECVVLDTQDCCVQGCQEETQYSQSFDVCELIPAFGGGRFGQKTFCNISPITGRGAETYTVEIGAQEINGRQGHRCREVLGMVVTIPKCHLDPENPQITDPPKYGIPGVGNSFNLPQSDLGFMLICEKYVQGYGTLGDFVGAITANMQSDIQITVEEPRLWLSKRPQIDECSGEEYLRPSDLLSRIQITETLDSQILEYYFIPTGYVFQVDAQVDILPALTERKYEGDSPVCNPFCECQSGKVFKLPSEAFGNSSKFSYFSNVYYLYENESGETPTLFRGEFQQSPEFGNSPDNGYVVAPPSVVDDCEFPPIPNLIGLAIRSKSSCITYTTGEFPECNITSTVEENSCYADFLNISFG
jgi:hypothetical protein